MRILLKIFCYQAAVLLMAGPTQWLYPSFIMAEESANASSPAKSWIEPKTGMEFVYVKGGCYQMGCGDWTSECDKSEKPVHEVCIDGFLLGKFEVTQGQWQKIMGSNPSKFKLGENYPVETVSWNDVQKFIAKFNKTSSRSFRLPSEAEWEYAARSGGKEEKFSGGKDLTNFTWCSFNSENTTHPVGTKTKNNIGIYDMSGNVSEWTEDWYQADYYSVSPRNNPRGPISGPGRVYRGGCWGNVPGFLRVAARNWNPPSLGSSFIGFRLLLPGEIK